MSNIMKEEIINIFSNNPWNYSYSFSGYSNVGRVITYIDGKYHSEINYDEKGRTHGKVIECNNNGKRLEYNMKKGTLHGEYKRWGINGVEKHVWYEDGHIVADFLKNPDLKKKYHLTATREINEI